MEKPPGDPALHAAVVERLDWLVRPCAEIDVVGPPVRAGGSQLRGHRYLAAGESWPESNEGPCGFGMQILPDWDDLPEAARQDPIWGHLAAAHREDGDDPAFGHRELARRGSRRPSGRRPAARSAVSRRSPRSCRTIAEATLRSGTRPRRCWWSSTGCRPTVGDAGIAHLFADPVALARGELSSIRCPWDCLRCRERRRGSDLVWRAGTGPSQGKEH